MIHKTTKEEIRKFINFFLYSSSEKKDLCDRATIDYSCGMGYIYFHPKADGDQSYETLEIEDETGNVIFIADLDKEGCLFGVEVFNAIKRMPKWLLSFAENITQAEECFYY